MKSKVTELNEKHRFKYVFCLQKQYLPLVKVYQTEEQALSSPKSCRSDPVLTGLSLAQLICTFKKELERFWEHHSRHILLQRTGALDLLPEAPAVPSKVTMAPKG